MKKSLKKIFGGLNITWPKLIIFAVIMGIYTALMAMLVPDGNSFHDIAVTPEWWVLPALLIIVNCKKPLDAAFKTFVFFLISQPLVYLIQVPFNSMGWGLFGYYRYWFLITLLTFPGAYLGWFVKKDKWYSGVILSVMTILLVWTAHGYIMGMSDHFPNHLISTIYCIGIIPVFVFGIFKDKWARIITLAISVIATLALFIAVGTSEPYEVINNVVFKENNITFVGEPSVSAWSGEGEGHAEIRKVDDSYILKLSGDKKRHYEFTVSDDRNEYDFEYYFDEGQQTVLVKKK